MKYRSLEEAVFHGNSLADPVEYVMEKGDPDELFCDQYGNSWTLLHYMIVVDEKIGVEYMLDNGADIERRGSDNTTPLRLAVEKGNKCIVEYLLSRGADVNSKCKEGNTALHIALTNERKDLVDVLLKNGADIDLPNDLGITSRQLMLYKQAREVVPDGLWEEAVGTFAERSLKKT